MTISVLYFAHFQDCAGASSETLNIAEGSTVGDLARAIEERHRLTAGFLACGRASVNVEFVDGTFILSQGDEVAWMPPMSGG
jgi:molybdopterin converting factor subunit 1